MFMLDSKWMYLLKHIIPSEYEMRYWLILLLNIVLVGCSLGPDYTPPEMDVPCTWNADPSDGMQLDPADSFLWWESLNDPTLNSLIERANQQNLDLYIAATRVLQAREAQKAGTSGQLPHIDGSATYGHVGYDQRTLDKILGVAPAPGKKHHREVNFFEVGFDAEWELDFFGVNAHEMNAQKAEMEASEDNFYDVMITLTAEVARNYIELRGFQHRLEILKKNIVDQGEAVKLTQGLLNIGFSSTIDVRQTEEQLSILSAEKPILELSIEKAIHRLSILLAYSPGELYCELKDPQPLPSLPCYKPIGIPSELLRRRPDIRKAERQLAASNERVASAVASLFPRISLRGFVGDIGTNLCSGGFTWFAGPQLLMPIFNSKLIQQDITLNKIKTEEACYEYQKAVLNALEETENAIASFHHELEMNRLLLEANKASKESHELTSLLYQKGLKDYLEVLVTERSLLSTEDAYIQSQIDLLLDYISLYKALGGGWDNCACADPN